MLDHENPFCCGAIFGGGRATFGKQRRRRGGVLLVVVIDDDGEEARSGEITALCVFLGKETRVSSRVSLLFLAISLFPHLFSGETISNHRPMFNTRCSTPPPRYYILLDLHHEQWVVDGAPL